MGSKTKIDWADSTWNPVTGCLHGCEYCYARRIAERFSCEGQTLDAPAELQRVWLKDSGADLRKNGCHVLRYPVWLKDSGRICPYPFGFAPTFHRYLLEKPEHWKKPRSIFVCSMADLFGAWVPEKLSIDQVKKLELGSVVYLIGADRHGEKTTLECTVVNSGIHKVLAYRDSYGYRLTKPIRNYFGKVFAIKA